MPSHNDVSAKCQGHKPHSPREEQTGSSTRTTYVGKSSAAYNKEAQAEPEVRINIIVDPDSGETIGTMTLVDNSLSGINFKEAKQGSHITESAAANDTVSSGNALASEEVTDETEQENTPESMEEVEKQDAVLYSLPSMAPEDTYSGMTPREAAAEQKRLESWIKWATITGRDPTVWQQRRKMARKRAAHRRVFKRRMLIYSQRVKNALLAREGDHTTHASFEALKAIQ